MMDIILNKISRRASKYILATIISPWWIFSLKNASHMQNDKNTDTLRKLLFTTDSIMSYEFFGRSKKIIEDVDDDDSVFTISYGIMGCCLQHFMEGDKKFPRQGCTHSEACYDKPGVVFESSSSMWDQRYFENLAEYSDHGHSKKVTADSLKLLTDNQNELEFWKNQAGGSVKLLNPTNFEAGLSDKKHALVFFYSPLCPHCRAAKPEYAYAAQQFRSNPEYRFAAVDCIAEPDLCRSFKVEGYPTLIYFRYGKKKRTYRGGRKADDFINFMKTISFQHNGDQVMIDRSNFHDEFYIQESDLIFCNTSTPLYYETV